MQSRLYVNGKEVQNPVVRGFAVTMVLGILSLVFLILAVLFVSILGIGIGIGAGIAGVGLGGMAIRRAIAKRQIRRLQVNSPSSDRLNTGSTKELPPGDEN